MMHRDVTYLVQLDHFMKATVLFYRVKFVVVSLYNYSILFLIHFFPFTIYLNCHHEKEEKKREEKKKHTQTNDRTKDSHTYK